MSLSIKFIQIIQSPTREYYKIGNYLLSEKTNNNYLKTCLTDNIIQCSDYLIQIYQLKFY